MAGTPQLKPPAAIRPVAALLAGLAGAALLAGWMVAAAPAGLRPELAQRLSKIAAPMQQGEDYRLVRRRLLAMGWRPQQRPAEPGCLLLPGDRRCALYPELASCALTGLGLCRFDWTSPSGVPYAVITRQGTADGLPGLIARWFISR
jgi:hypothetical protein